jgi:hypothetical protein
MSPESDARTTERAVEPALSVVLITPDSFETIRRTITCLAAQTAHDRIELIVIAPESARIDIDRALVAPLADVRVIQLPSLVPTGPARGRYSCCPRADRRIWGGALFPAIDVGAGAHRCASR